MLTHFKVFGDVDQDGSPGRRMDSSCGAANREDSIANGPAKLNLARWGCFAIGLHPNHFGEREQ